MKKLLLFITCLALTVSCASVKEQTNIPSGKKTLNTNYEDMDFHQSIPAIIQAAPNYRLPYLRPKELKESTLGIAITGDTIPNKVYSNVQCTEFVYPDSYQGMPKVKTKIEIPGNSYMLLVTRVASGELSTEGLILTDKSGKIYDALIGKVMNSRGTIVKQFYVKKDGEITVISIEPEDKQLALPLKEVFPDFYGNRTDCIYKVESGKFVLKNEKRYAPKIYSYQMLTDVSYDLWNGRETSSHEDKKSASQVKDSDSLFTVSDARKFHEKNFVMPERLTEEEYIYGLMLPFYELRPDWNTSACYARSGISYVEVPVNSTYSVTKRNRFTGMDYELKSHSSLIFRKDATGMTREYIRILIPDRENDSSQLLQKVTETDNERYSGIKIYTDMSGNILHMERIENGYILQKVNGDRKSRYISVLGEIFFFNDYLQKRWWKLGTWKPSKDYIEW